jgi:hypothetical protein
MTQIRSVSSHPTLRARGYSHATPNARPRALTPAQGGYPVDGGRPQAIRALGSGSSSLVALMAIPPLSSLKLGLLMES